jgi:hypothetical protein
MPAISDFINYSQVRSLIYQPLKEELVQSVGRVQWNPMAGVVDLLVALHEDPDIFMGSPSR